MASSEPATGPTIHPAVNAIRTIDTTPSPTGLLVAFKSSWTAANSCELAAPAKARTTALITNGIHTWVATAMAHQPNAPASAHSRKKPSRRPVRSERAPMRYPATGAVMFVR